MFGTGTGPPPRGAVFESPPPRVGEVGASAPGGGAAVASRSPSAVLALAASCFDGLSMRVRGALSFISP